MARDDQPTVAFVLSGGASLGAIQAGMLRAIYERGVVSDLIVGTSAGALNGAFIASRPQTAATADELGDVWRGLRRGQVFPLNPVTGLLGFIGSRNHLVPASGLRRLIARHLRGETFDDLAIPLHVVAADVLSGEEPTGHACALDDPPNSPVAMALHAISLLTQRRLIADIDRHRDAAHLIVLPPPCPLRVPPIDFAHADELIDLALRDARELLDGGGADRPPIKMRMHRHPGAEDVRPQPQRSPTGT